MYFANIANPNGIQASDIISPMITATISRKRNIPMNIRIITVTMFFILTPLPKEILMGNTFYSPL